MKGGRGGLASVRPPNGRRQVVSINGALRGAGPRVRRFPGEGAGAVSDRPLGRGPQGRPVEFLPLPRHTAPHLPSATALARLRDILLVDAVVKTP